MSIVVLTLGAGLCGCNRKHAFRTKARKRVSLCRCAEAAMFCSLFGVSAETAQCAQLQTKFVLADVDHNSAVTDDDCRCREWCN